MYLDVLLDAKNLMFKDCCFFNKYQLKIEDLPEELVDDIKVTFKIFDVDNGRNTYRFW